MFIQVVVWVVLVSLVPGFASWIPLSFGFSQGFALVQVASFVLPLSSVLLPSFILQPSFVLQLSFVLRLSFGEVSSSFRWFWRAWVPQRVVLQVLFLLRTLFLLCGWEGDSGVWGLASFISIMVQF